MAKVGVGVAIFVCACASSQSSSEPAPADAGLDAAPDATADAPPLDAPIADSPDECACTPGLHNDAIVVLSDDGSLWSFAPAQNQFAEIAPLPCATSKTPFSLAVDQRGLAWILFADDADLRTFDLNQPSAGCTDPGYTPNQASFGLFGMAFSVESAAVRCEKLYLHSYSGSGPFSEGPGVGSLGVLDPATLVPSSLASIDYDGGELSGSGEGRLFAFAGQTPAKLVEYDKSSGATLSTTPLTGLSKTNASAFAFFGGAFYFFTEAPPKGCDACLDQSCAAAASSCKSDPACAAAFACALEKGDITDECGGLMPSELQSCLAGPCLNACLPHPSERVSQVHRFVPATGALALVVPEAPIRIVGAGTSTCVSFVPR